MLFFQPNLLVTQGHSHHNCIRIGVLTSKSIIFCHRTWSYWVPSPPVPLVKDSLCLYHCSRIWDERTLEWDSSRVFSTSLCYFQWGFPFPAPALGASTEMQDSFLDETPWSTQCSFIHYSACDAITVINESTKSQSPADSPCLLPCGVSVPISSWPHPLITLPSGCHPRARGATPTHSPHCSGSVKCKQRSLTKAIRARRCHLTILLPYYRY